MPPISFAHHLHRAVCLLILICFAVASLAVLPLANRVALAQSDGAPMRAQGPVPVADLAEELLDAVVNISTSQRVAGRRIAPAPNVPEGSPFEDFFQDFFNEDGEREGPSRENSLGSGFVIDTDGIVVTNNHVISGADDIDVVMTDGRVYPATVIGRDEATDLAVLQIVPDEPLAFVPFGNSDALRIGDWALAIGNPFGLGGSVSLGIVSAMNRNIGAGPYDSFIQTDAAINRGNSGGPLFNLDGEVIGVNTAILSPNGRSVGVGFAIPSNTVETIVSQLIMFGETRRGLLGVNIQEVTPDMAEGLSLDRPRGALVSAVNEGGPAEDAGIERGDVIISFNGRNINVYTDLTARVAQTAPGTEVPVQVIRRGETLDLMVVLALRDGERVEIASLPPETEPIRLLGMELSTIDEAYELGFEMEENATGAVVTMIERDGPADAKGIQPGTLILEVGQQLVETPSDVVDRVAELEEEGRSQILLLILNNEGESEFVALSFD